MQSVYNLSTIHMMSMAVYVEHTDSPDSGFESLRLLLEW